jgi:hypothetical protein
MFCQVVDTCRLSVEKKRTLLPAVIRRISQVKKDLSKSRGISPLKSCVCQAELRIWIRIRVKSWIRIRIIGEIQKLLETKNRAVEGRGR